MPRLARPVPPAFGRSPRRASLLAALAVAGAAVTNIAAVQPTLAWTGGTFNPASEQELFGDTNAARASAGMPALHWDSALAAIARSRSEDMIDRDYFSHNIPPTGEMVWDVMDQDGYCYNVAGENIGWNLNWPDDQATYQIEQSFLGSPEHRDNILGVAWNSIGIGAFKGDDGKIMWTVLFADKCGTATGRTTPSSVSATTRQESPATASGTHLQRVRSGSNNVVWLTFSLGPTMAGRHVEVREAARGCASGYAGVACGSGRTYGTWTDFTRLTTRIADANGTIRVALSSHSRRWVSIQAVVTADFPMAGATTAAQQVRWR
jgi:uncharacterized protein YkwD